MDWKTQPPANLTWPPIFQDVRVFYRITGALKICTDDLKECQDGSKLARQGADCEFPDCPNISRYRPSQLKTIAPIMAAIFVGIILTIVGCAVYNKRVIF